MQIFLSIASWIGVFTICLCQIILVWWHYPWLFCYLYCDVCIIDQNNIDITKKMHFEDIKGSPFRSQTNGSRNLEYKYIIWCIFILPHVWLPETLSLKTFQYNYPIFKYGLKETELCIFCSETEKSLLYLFLGMPPQ
jgi:hypothetical protein